MFRVFGCAQDYDPGLWATVDNDGEILALLLPAQITVLGGPLRFLTTRAVAYGSVLCAPGAEGLQALDLLLRTYNGEMKSSVLFTELRNLSDQSDLRPALEGCGFVYEDHLNFLIDLKRPQTSCGTTSDPMPGATFKKRANQRWRSRRSRPRRIFWQPMRAGAAGALALTAGVFLPAFAFTLIGHQWVERLVEQRRTHALLDGVTAGVVGLIAVTALQLARDTLTSAATIAIFAAASFAAFRWRAKTAVVWIVAGAAAAGALLLR